MKVAKARRVPFKDLGLRAGEVYSSAVDAPRIGAIFSGLPGAALLKSGRGMGALIVFLGLVAPQSPRYEFLILGIGIILVNTGAQNFKPS